MTLANEALPESRARALLVAKPMSVVSIKETRDAEIRDDGYGDRAGYERTPKDVRDAAHAHDAELKQRGALMGVAGAPVQVRNASTAGVRTENSAFMSSALPVAGFALIEAADLAEAITIVSQTPCAVAHGAVEVWPLEQAG